MKHVIAFSTFSFRVCYIFIVFIYLTIRCVDRVVNCKKTNGIDIVSEPQLEVGRDNEARSHLVYKMTKVIVNSYFFIIRVNLPLISVFRRCHLLIPPPLIPATPVHIDYASLRADLSQVDNVAAVHDLHVWSLNMEKAALSVHLAVGESCGVWWCKRKIGGGDWRSVVDFQLNY